MVCSQQARCGNGSCTYDEIIDKICEVLEQNIENFEIHLKNENGETAKLHKKLINNLEQKLKDLEAKEVAQWEAQAHPDPSQRMPTEIFKKLNEKLLTEKEEVRKALDNAFATMPQPADYERKLYMFRDALEALKDPHVEPIVKNALLKACIDRIDYYRERPERKQPVAGNGAFPMIETQWTKPLIELDIHLRV
jgi:hypothetical protein